MNAVDTLEQRYAEVMDRVAEAARRAGRSPSDIVVVAVTKHAEPEQVRALVDLGHADLGENRVQQLVQRAATLDEHLLRRQLLAHLPAPGRADHAPAAVRWHMIGHLQRNKARKAVEICRLIQSVDSLRLAEEIQAIALKRDRPVEVLLQVNASGSASKFGCPRPAARHLADQIDTMVNVQLRGLMTMADNPADAPATFARARELFDDMVRAGAGEGRFNILSMGMSSDYEIAIAEGANMVRVGSAIFGEPAPGADSAAAEDQADA